MMHKHDFELITAIAQGAMKPHEQAVAEASLASCESCNTDLQLQREALAALHTAPAVIMTDFERAALHRYVAAQRTAVDKRSGWKPTVPWFQRLLPAMAAAAAVLVVVGVGTVFVNRVGDADLVAETTTAAGQSPYPAADEGKAEARSGAPNDDTAEAPTTMAALGAPQSSIEEYGSITSAELANIAGRMGSFEESDAADDYSADRLRSLSLDPALICSDVALGEGTITAIGRATVDGDGVEIYQIDDLVKVYSIADCSLVASFE